MRDEYVGDVGDFGKYILLKELANIVGNGVKIGINWYYNTRPSPTYRYLYDDALQGVDRHLHDQLKSIVEINNLKLLKIIERCVLDDKFSHYAEEIPYNANSGNQREEDRKKWFEGSLRSGLEDADIIFLDPDNGIANPVGDNIFNPTIAKSQKDAVLYAYSDEILNYYNYEQKKKSIIIYNHRDHSIVTTYRKKFDLLRDKVNLSPSDSPILRCPKVTVRDYLFLPQVGHIKDIKKLVNRLTAESPFKEKEMFKCPNELN